MIRDFLLGIVGGFWTGILAAHFPELPLGLQIALVALSVALAFVLLTWKRSFWARFGGWLRSLPAFGIGFVRTANRLVSLAELRQVIVGLAAAAGIVSVFAPTLGRSLPGSLLVFIVVATAGLAAVANVLSRTQQGQGR